jgi:hypothetical protein
MRKLLLLSACLAALASASMAGESGVRLAALDAWPPPYAAQNFTPRADMRVAEQVCSTICDAGGPAFTASCSDTQTCDCNCKHKPVCQCH